ncbi:hypothetical protein DdX_12413 [Ditylenchus destructor]|uniref:Uncharacterized protein n=1 Tax=Ditylenchus destructor TaxID=166010 RepID=A0AAD4MVR6_9BILA|nr:hypothetical protein DdX_12413 [Ditylenchus destructor]
MSGNSFLCVAAIISTIHHCFRSLRAKQLPANKACDETAVWLDPTSGKCVDYKGAKDVTVVSTRHEKARVTVMLTAKKNREYGIHIQIYSFIVTNKNSFSV